jgi:hypothetical protein
MRMLVVYYSLAGTTRTVAKEVANELSAELEEIRCDRYRPGFIGFARAAFDSATGRLPPIERPQHDVALYDVVVIGGPIWASHPATPVRAYLRHQAGRLPAVAVLLTHGGSPPEKALREMAQLAGSAAKATLVVREADVKSATFQPAVAAFAQTLRLRAAA